MFTQEYRITGCEQMSPQSMVEAMKQSFNTGFMYKRVDDNQVIQIMKAHGCTEFEAMCCLEKMMMV
jgi:hypothetical protein